MTPAKAKAITMAVLSRIARVVPVQGYLAECGGRSMMFQTMQAAQNWIYSQPDYLRCDANEMPSISFGYYKHLIIPIP